MNVLRWYLMLIDKNVECFVTRNDGNSILRHGRDHLKPQLAIRTLGLKPPNFYQFVGPRGKVVIIWIVLSSNTCYRLSSWAFLVKLLSDECRTKMIGQYWFSNWCRQPLPEPMLTQIYMASLYRNELTHWDRDKMADNLLITLTMHLPEKSVSLIKFRWSLLLPQGHDRDDGSCFHTTDLFNGEGNDSRRKGLAIRNSCLFLLLTKAVERTVK